MSAVFRNVFRQNVATPALRLQLARLCSTVKNPDTGAPSPFNKDALKKIVRSNKVVVFMKGNPETPRCGFSNAVVQIFRMHGVPYDAHDVLESEDLRQGIKEFTDWPTIPQVFIDGEFVGGCDILLQMHQSGDLIEELKKVGIESHLLRKAQAADATDADSNKKQ